jgi:murein DD-endopeptidase
VVATVVDDVREPTVPVTVDNAAGNYVTIDVGGGRFASYEHVQPHSTTVKVGDHVRRGQVLARLGASGSVSSGPHLHFHVSDANSPLAAEGLPYVFKSFAVLGAFESLDALVQGKAWTRLPGDSGGKTRLELPRHQTVVRF